MSKVFLIMDVTESYVFEVCNSKKEALDNQYDYGVDTVIIETEVQ